jgi:hypothetical protein
VTKFASSARPNGATRLLQLIFSSYLIWFYIWQTGYASGKIWELDVSQLPFSPYHFNIEVGVMKFSRAISRVKWSDVGLLTAQPFDPADSPRELHTQSQGKQQISVGMVVTGIWSE